MLCLILLVLLFSRRYCAPCGYYPYGYDSVPYGAYSPYYPRSYYGPGYRTCYGHGYRTYGY